MTAPHPLPNYIKEVLHSSRWASGTLRVTIYPIKIRYIALTYWARGFLSKQTPPNQRNVGLRAHREPRFKRRDNMNCLKSVYIQEMKTHVVVVREQVMVNSQLHPSIAPGSEMPYSVRKVNKVCVPNTDFIGFRSHAQQSLSHIFTKSEDIEY